MTSVIFKINNEFYTTEKIICSFLITDDYLPEYGFSLKKYDSLVRNKKISRSKN